MMQGFLGDKANN